MLVGPLKQRKPLLPELFKNQIMLDAFEVHVFQAVQWVQLPVLLPVRVTGQRVTEGAVQCSAGEECEVQAAPSSKAVVGSEPDRALHCGGFGPRQFGVKSQLEGTLAACLFWG